MSATGGFAPGLSENAVLIARLIAADTSTIAENLDRARDDLAAQGMAVAMAETIWSGSNGIELLLPEGDPDVLRRILDARFAPCDLLVADHTPIIPHVFVSDMDSTMIAAECIDELADFAGIKPQIAAITERAMQGELDFAAALHERVGLLRDLDEASIGQCLAERVAPMPGARCLVQTLRANGCHTVLVTGGFHQFADPVAEQLGFEHVVANRLDVADGKLTGGLVGGITDANVKRAVLLKAMEGFGENAVSLAMGDGANDIPMLEAATYGIAFRAKPKARDAADGWIDRGDLTSVLELLGIPRDEWVWE
jgi:phosphoserine phosphatase